jgi:hypothetical protein
VVCEVEVLEFDTARLDGSLDLQAANRDLIVVPGHPISFHIRFDFHGYFLLYLLRVINSRPGFRLCLMETVIADIEADDAAIVAKHQSPKSKGRIAQ